MFIVFTDLDGTLLDHDTYDYSEALEGMKLLRDNKYPLVLVSSKTLPEMELLHKELSLDTPIIFENGGGIAFPDKDTGRFEIEYPGFSIEELENRIDKLSSVLGCDLLPITEMTLHEVCDFTGLDTPRAALAKQRLASLPFILKCDDDYTIEDLNRFNTVLHRDEVQVTKGGRFYHFLSLKSNKGNAIVRVLDWFKEKEKTEIKSAGIGDSENDIPMLEAVDVPFLVRKKDGKYIDAPINGLNKTESAGPAGFTEAIRQICS